MKKVCMKNRERGREYGGEVIFFNLVIEIG
jgi:hypothetical protein